MPGSAKLLYFADPMCSWCWGFAPVIDEISKQFSERLEVVPVMGGLRAGETRGMTAEVRSEILHHWEQVHAATAQPFAIEGALPDGFVYNTEPACRAVVAIREIDGNAAALVMLKEVQGAFYRDGRDVTDESVLADVAASIGHDPGDFKTCFQSKVIEETTAKDFAAAMEHGVGGFPTTITDISGHKRIIAMGYQPYQAIRERLERRLS